MAVCDVIKSLSECASKQKYVLVVQEYIFSVHSVFIKHECYTKASGQGKCTTPNIVIAFVNTTSDIPAKE